MNLLDAVIRQIDVEHRLADLYNHFYKAFRDRAVVNIFWLEMSVEESGHEHLLRRLLDAVKERPGELPEVPALTAERFNRLENQISRSRLESKGMNFSLSRAFEMASAFESGEAEILFRTILEWLDPKFDHTLGRFINENLEHKRRLETMKEAVLSQLVRGEEFTLLWSGEST